MLKTIMGLMLGLMLGAVCRWLDFPVPSPPQLVGAFLVVSITVGYTLMDKFLTRMTPPSAPTTVQMELQEPTNLPGTKG